MTDAISARPRTIERIVKPVERTSKKGVIEQYDEVETKGENYKPKTRGIIDFYA
jgi:hypothetical protein